MISIYTPDLIQNVIHPLLRSDWGSMAADSIALYKPGAISELFKTSNGFKIRSLSENESIKDWLKSDTKRHNFRKES